MLRPCSALSLGPLGKAQGSPIPTSVQPPAASGLQRHLGLEEGRQKGKALFLPQWAALALDLGRTGERRGTECAGGRRLGLGSRNRGGELGRRQRWRAGPGGRLDSPWGLELGLGLGSGVLGRALWQLGSWMVV